MKKAILIILLVSFVAVTFTSCSKSIFGGGGNCPTNSKPGKR